MPYKSAAWDWNHYTVWHRSRPLCHSGNADVDRTVISWGVRKDGSQLSVLTPCALFLCSGVSCFGTHLAHNFLNNRCSVRILCNKERQICGKLLLAQLIMNFHRRCALCIQKLYHRPDFIVGGSWNKSLHLQSLQRRYCENSGSLASTCVMRRHYSIKYTHSLHAINGLIAVGRVGNLLCGHPSYITLLSSFNFQNCMKLNFYLFNEHG